MCGKQIYIFFFSKKKNRKFVRHKSSKINYLWLDKFYTKVLKKNISEIIFFYFYFFLFRDTKIEFQQKYENSNWYHNHIMNKLKLQQK